PRPGAHVASSNRTSQMRFFVRRRGTDPETGARGGSLPPLAVDALRQRASRRVRPGAEALVSRQLLAAGARATTPAQCPSGAQALQPYFAEYAFPGVSVTVVEHGQVALAQGYGVGNASNGAPVTADTRFDIGSLTKTFTALGVLLLYQDSQNTSHPLDLNAPI